MSISFSSKNNQTLTHEALGSEDTTIDEMAISLDDAVRQIDHPGTPIIKSSKNNKSLSFGSENQV